MYQSSGIPNRLEQGEVIIVPRIQWRAEAQFSTNMFIYQSMTVLLLNFGICAVKVKQLLFHSSSQSARGLSGESPTPSTPWNAGSSRTKPAPILTDIIDTTDCRSRFIQVNATPEAGRVPIVSPITAHFWCDAIRTSIMMDVIEDIAGCGQRDKGQKDDEESCNEEEVVIKDSWGVCLLVQSFYLSWYDLQCWNQTDFALANVENLYSRNRRGTL